MDGPHGEALTIISVGILIIGTLMALLGSAASTANRDRAPQSARLAAIEHKLAAVIAHLGVTVPEPEQPGRGGNPMTSISALAPTKGMPPPPPGGGHGGPGSPGGGQRRPDRRRRVTVEW